MLQLDVSLCRLCRLGDALVAVFSNHQCAGQPIPGATSGYQTAHDIEQTQSQMCDLQLELQVDPKTAERIYQLHALKQEAVEREDYDEAKRLKDSIGRLKQVGQKLAQLEAQKKVPSAAVNLYQITCLHLWFSTPNHQPRLQAAVEREDYELAKQIKLDADRLRAAGEAAAGTAGHSPVRLGSHPDDIFNRVLQPQMGKAISPPTKGDRMTQLGTSLIYLRLFMQLPACITSYNLSFLIFTGLCRRRPEHSRQYPSQSH